MDRESGAKVEIVEKMEVPQLKVKKSAKKCKRIQTKNEDKAKKKDLRRREKRTMPTRERRLKKSSMKNIGELNKWLTDVVDDQMNAKRRQKKSGLTEEQRVSKNAYQRRWRASLTDEQRKKLKNIRDPLKRALAEGKDIFVNRQGKRFKICDCQKTAFFANDEKHSSVQDRPIVEHSASVNIVVKPDIMLDECIGDVEVDTKPIPIKGFDNIVVKIEKDDDIHEQIEEEKFRDCKSFIKLEPQPIKSDQET